MTEEDTESIWGATLDTTRFDNVGIRIAEQLNFWVKDDATDQVTDTKVTPILEQISEEILFDLIEASKGTGVVDPWVFIQANAIRVSVRIVSNYGTILDKIKKILDRNKTIEIVKRTL